MFEEERINVATRRAAELNDYGDALGASRAVHELAQIVRDFILRQRKKLCGGATRNQVADAQTGQRQGKADPLYAEGTSVLQTDSSLLQAVSKSLWPVKH
jgi:hypothetical protein